MPNEVEEVQAAEPEQIAAPEVQGETAPESASGENEPTHEEVQAKKGGFQRRIDKLTREIGDTKRYNEYLAAELAKRNGGETPAKTVTQPVTPAADARPKLDDFDSQDEYLDALTDWKVDQKLKATESERRQEAVRSQQKTAEQEFLKRRDDFRALTSDFDEVLADADVPLSPAMAQELIEHEHGPALMYFLATNPDEADKLVGLSPTALARAVARLESRFVPQQQAQGEVKPARTVSQAPKPPTPVGKTTSTAGKNPDDMDPAEYREWRKKNFPSL